MFRLVLCLLLMCAVPAVSWAQERPAETRAASFGSGVGAARSATTAVMTAPGTGMTTDQSRRMTRGFLTQVGVGLTIGLSDRVGLTTSFDVLPSSPNPAAVASG